MIDFFKFFLTNEILDIIICCTDEYSQAVIGQEWIDISGGTSFSLSGVC